MKIDLLHDQRLTTPTANVLWAIMHNEFEHGDSGRVICDRSYLTPRKKKLAKAKKEVEAIGGELVFAPRGAKHIEVLFHIPR
jgi:hypothetical protein